MRYHRTFGLGAEQLGELEARIEDILPEPWDKGTGRPKSLSLLEAIMVTLLYKRQNMIEEVSRGLPKSSDRTRRKLALVDGISDEFGNIIFVSDPAPGSDHDMKKREGEVKEILDLAGSVIADKGFQGSGYVTSAKKPQHRELYT